MPVLSSCFVCLLDSFAPSLTDVVATFVKTATYSFICLHEYILARMSICNDKYLADAFVFFGILVVDVCTHAFTHIAVIRTGYRC